MYIQRTETQAVHAGPAAMSLGDRLWKPDGADVLAWLVLFAPRSPGVCRADSPRSYRYRREPPACRTVAARAKRTPRTRSSLDWSLGKINRKEQVIAIAAVAQHRRGPAKRYKVITDRKGLLPRCRFLRITRIPVFTNRDRYQSGGARASRSNPSYCDSNEQEAR